MTPSTRTIRVLPHDVHLIIASFADRKSLLALLATSRGLHSDCGKFILQDTVVLRDDLDIHSFLDFMHPHKGKRWRHLHSLYLREAPITPVVAEELATVIPRASHLQSLEFENAEGTLGAHPDLPLAFAAIPSIKHITIEHGYQHTCAMLEAMHWPLETAVLRTTAYTSHWPDADAGGRMHPAAILKNSRATLKILKCDAWSDCSATLQTYPVYPKLEYLTVTGIWCPRTAQWAITYPTLKRLTMYTIESHTTMDDEELADQELTRSVNVNEYMAQGQQWRDLERFHGGTLDLYLLGFTCRIQDVSLTLSADELQFFSPTMATARPTHLSLSITTRLFSQLVPTYLHDPGLADLKSFELNATVWIGGTDRYEGGTDVDGYLGHVFDLLRRASVQQFTFSLTVQSSLSRTRRFIFPTESPELASDPREQMQCALRRLAVPPSPLEIWVEDVDLDALAHRFLEEAPSLQSVKLHASLSGHRRGFVELSRTPQSSDRLQDADLLVS